VLSEFPLTRVCNWRIKTDGTTIFGNAPSVGIISKNCARSIEFSGSNKKSNLFKKDMADICIVSSDGCVPLNLLKSGSLFKFYKGDVLSL
jgi:hypothetical protein